MRKAVKRSFVLFVIGFCCLGSRCSSVDREANEIGQNAIAFTQTILSFGPRVSGTENISHVRGFLKEIVSSHGFTPSEDAFTATTPLGDIDMVNISFTIPGKSSGQKVVLMAHYDSKKFDSFEFLGANDAASSVALLLALVPTIKKMSLNYDVEIVFVDGEEAFVNWSSTDSLYGSRRYATQMSDPTKIQAAIIVDMIGDKDLSFIRSQRSSQKLVSKMEATLEKLQKSSMLETQIRSVEDDHIPLADLGIPVLHLMDFTYGGPSTPGFYWHTVEDTLDKLSVASLATTSQVILGVLSLL
ncbi:MAG: M28 family peptidase [Bdellovibrionales bacterium]|nr:M28 family peptidase [Bdellovibrionales bacterium]